MNRARLWMKAVQLIDPTMVLCEYHFSEKITSISFPKKFHTGIIAFIKYFSGANPHACCQIWMGHNEPMSNIQVCLQGWATDNDTQMYVKKLQHKDTVREYWLLWSHQNIDIKVLQEATSQALKIIAPTYQPNFTFI